MTSKTRTPLRRCVFVDRDGVVTSALNINVADETALVPGAREAIAMLRAAGFLVILVTNQGGLGENLDGSVRWKNRPLTREALAAIHARLAELLGEDARLDAVKVCPHSKSISCPCRKPSAGMILEAAAEWGIDLSGSFMIGDRATDVEAGNNAGVTSILVLTGPDGAQTKEKDIVGAGTLVLPSLLEAAKHILAQPAPKRTRAKATKKSTTTKNALVTSEKKPADTMTAAELIAQIARPQGAKSAVLMVGVPASGKSTFCDPLETRGYVRLSMDAIRKELFGDEGIIGDDKGAKLVRETFRQRLEEQLAAGKRVLIDNTNFSQRTRKPVLDRISAAGYTDVQLLILDVPLDECLRRNKGRTRVVNEEFMTMTYRELHGSGWPTSQEGKRVVIKPGTTRDEFVVTFPA